MTSPFAVAEPRVLIVSKPLVPPWDDATKNLARDLALYAEGARFSVFGSRIAPFESARVRTEPLFDSAAGYQPASGERLRVLGRLLRPDPDVDIYHFFYAPNAAASIALRLVTRGKRQKTIHTITSRPADWSGVRHLVFADAAVALSEDSRRRLVEAGVRRVVKIHPGIADPAEPAPDASRWESLRRTGDEVLALYAGDYEFTGGHGPILEIAPRLFRENPNLRFVFACRAKTPRAAEIERRFRKEVDAGIPAGRFVFLKEVPDMRALITACDFTLFPARSLFRKMDLPLVLIESLALSRPVVASDLDPLRELLAGGGGWTVPLSEREAFSRRILELASDCGLRERLGREGRAAFLERFEARRMAASYEVLYRELLSERRPRPGTGTRLAADYYDRFSRIYDRNRQAGYHALVDEIETDAVRRYVSGRRALEIGCGTGLIMDRLKNDAREIVGVDASPGMLEEARRRGLGVREGNAENLPFADGEFDVTYSFKVLAHVRNVAGALSEMARVTRKGGIVAAEFYNARSLRAFRWIVRKRFTPRFGGGLDEREIFTRYDTLKTIRSYLPPDLRLVETRGAIVWTPAAFFHRIPVLGPLLAAAERRSSSGPLARFAGFLILILEKV